MAHPNYIKMHIRTVPELLRDCAETMYQRVKNTLEDEKLEQTQMVVMTGCGYSYAAACNGAEFIEKPQASRQGRFTQWMLPATRVWMFCPKGSRRFSSE